MQIKKQLVRQAILDAAWAEFSAKGFAGANLRAIAAAAGCSLSNLYNYFSSKDDLFGAIVGPRVDEIRRGLEWIRTYRMPVDKPYTTEEEEWQYFKHIADYMHNHRAELELIFLKSEGSSVAGLLDEAVEAYNHMWSNYHEHLQQNFAHKKFNRISDFFVHNMTHFFVNTLMEFLRHNIDGEDMSAYMEELFKFSYYGHLGMLER